jgi:membrane protease YdiL (CAAX protease family)
MMDGDRLRAALILVGVVPLLALVYGPLAHRTVRWTTRAAMRFQPMRARQLAQPAGECVAHLAAVCLLTMAALAAGVLPGIAAVVTRDIGDLQLAIAAVAVGTAEAGMATLAASVVLAIVATTSLTGHAAPGRPAVAEPSAAWLALPRSGWIRRWPKPGWGTPVATAGSVLFLLGVAAEEAVFRGFMITLLRPFGSAAAVAIAAAAYVGYGLSRPAAAGSAIEAACCCAVIGTVSGGLFTVVPALLPLIIAHLAFVLILG